ncbi:MAG: cytochrome c [Gammaproteobacteria bacterium]|nr:cytochrome c [Gammaproteobacteria bacterium]
MQHNVAARLLLAGAIVFSASTPAEDPVPADGPAWTGTSHPEDVIAARQALMYEIEQSMKPLDAYAAGEAGDPEKLKAAAGTIAAMLLAVPHLFPPTTNLYDSAAETPATLALPAIWQDFPAFYDLSSAAADAASNAASVTGDAGLSGAATALRGACDGCHALYLRPYEPAEVSSEDLEFDFDSVFDQD